MYIYSAYVNLSEIGPVVLEKNLFQCCQNISVSRFYILNLEMSLYVYLNPQSPSVDEIKLVVSPWKIVSAMGLVIYI